MRFRVLALALLVYVGIDFSDPSVPGVFFFDADQLFVDSVVPAKGNGLSAKPHVDPSRHPTLFDARWPTSPGPILRDVTVARRPPCYTREPRSTLRLAPDPSSDIDPLA